MHARVQVQVQVQVQVRAAFAIHQHRFVVTAGTTQQTSPPRQPQHANAWQKGGGSSVLLGGHVTCDASLRQCRMMEHHLKWARAGVRVFACWRARVGVWVRMCCD